MVFGWSETIQRCEDNCLILRLPFPISQRRTPTMRERERKTHTRKIWVNSHFGGRKSDTQLSTRIHRYNTREMGMEKKRIINFDKSVENLHELLNTWTRKTTLWQNVRKKDAGTNRAMSNKTTKFNQFLLWQERRRSWHKKNGACQKWKRTIYCVCKTHRNRWRELSGAQRSEHRIIDKNSILNYSNVLQRNKATKKR